MVDPRKTFAQERFEDHQRRQYFMGISVPSPEKEFLTELRNQLEGKPYTGSPPHITIVPPFTYHFEEPLLDLLKKWSKKQPTFEAELDQVGTFKHKETGTVYLQPKRPKPFIELEQSLLASIKYLPDSGQLVPHLTVANRVPLSELDAVKQQVRDLGLKLTLMVSSITLYKSFKPEPWQVLAENFFESENEKNY